VSQGSVVAERLKRTLSILVSALYNSCLCLSNISAKRYASAIRRKDLKVYVIGASMNITVRRIKC
jgi:hypothetical protein